ncbi:MAG TPA: DinB family protein [Anaerolineales bacterium]|nr:DinB family protein [Anaerolineales bacterium]
MNKQDILTLYKYNQWANAKILDAAVQVTQEQYLASASFPHGGLGSTLVHVMFAEWIWRQRWTGVSPTVRLKPEDFPTVEALRARWAEEEKQLMDFVERLTDERLDDTIEYKNTSGKPFTRILWHMMAHVVNHGTQHRAEAAALLTGFGHSPGDIDLIYFLE